MPITTNIKRGDPGSKTLLSRLQSYEDINFYVDSNCMLNTVENGQIELLLNEELPEIVGGDELKIKILLPRHVNNLDEKTLYEISGTTASISLTLETVSNCVCINIPANEVVVNTICGYITIEGSFDIIPAEELYIEQLCSATFSLCLDDFKFKLLSTCNDECTSNSENRCIQIDYTPKACLSLEYASATIPTTPPAGST